MYDNIGGKIKKIAKVMYPISLIASAITGFGVMAAFNFFMGLAVIGLGALISWLVSITFYGFGELIERFQGIETELSKQNQ